MKRKLIKFCAVTIAVAAAFSCTKPENGGENGGNGDDSGNGGGDNPGVVLPEVPETVVEGNVFKVDFFSALDGEPFFDRRDHNVIVTHIKGQEGKKPIVYMIDRADFAVGEPDKTLRIAMETSMDAYFAQNVKSGNSVEGTGMVTLEPVMKYDGVNAGGVFMSGCRLDAPLNQPVPVGIYTSRLESADGLKKLFEAKEKVLRGDGVLVGTVRSEAVTDVEKYIKDEAGPVRFVLLGSGESAYDLFVMVPGSFVCRGIEEARTVNCPYYRISIEKLL